MINGSLHFNYFSVFKKFVWSLNNTLCTQGTKAQFSLSLQKCAVNINIAR